MQLEAQAVSRAEFHEREGFAISYLTLEDFARFGAVKSDAEPVINALRSIAGVNIACMLRQHEDCIRGSLRAKDDTDVSAIARSFGGGGHVAAAGFTMHGSMQEAVDQGACGAARGGVRQVKRGESGLSLVVGVDKPSGMTSHDVVNRCRRIFGEKRVGHTGTLDPLASGVLPICVGPATRLGAYLTGHDKAYRATIAFGVGTDTDDCEGAVARTGQAPVEVQVTVALRSRRSSRCSGRRSRCRRRIPPSR